MLPFLDAITVIGRMNGGTREGRKESKKVSDREENRQAKESRSAAKNRSQMYEALEMPCHN